MFKNKVAIRQGFIVTKGYFKFFKCTHIFFFFWGISSSAMEVDKLYTNKVTLSSIEDTKTCNVPLSLICISQPLIDFAQQSGYKMQPFYDKTVLRDNIDVYSKILKLCKQNPKKLVSFLSEKNNGPKILNALILASLKKLEEIPTRCRPHFENSIPLLKWHNFPSLDRNLPTFQVPFPRKELSGIGVGDDMSLGILHQCIETADLRDAIYLNDVETSIRKKIELFSMSQCRHILLCLWDTALHLQILPEFNNAIEDLVAQNELGRSNVLGCEISKLDDGYKLIYYNIPKR